MTDIADLIRSLVLFGIGVGAVAKTLIAIRYATHAGVGVGRMLPSHVVLIAIGYLAIDVFLYLEISARVGTPLTYRSWLALIAVTITDVALFLLMAHIYQTTVARRPSFTQEQLRVMRRGHA